MLMNRRTMILSLSALAAPSARAVMMDPGGGGGCGGWDWEPWWPRSTVAGEVAQIAANHIWRLDPPTRNATREQWAAHMAAIFPQLVEQGFARLPARALNRRLEKASDADLQSMAQLYTSDLNALSRGGLALPVAAVRCSDAALMRLAGAFGGAAVYDAVARYAPAKLHALDRALPMMNQNPAPLTPNVDMTLRRIYDGFRLAPTGATSIPRALYQTAAYAAPRLVMAWSVGTGIGLGLGLLIEWASPTLWNAIGSGVNTIVEGLSGLTGVPLGPAQEALGYDFGLISYHDHFEQTGGDYAAVEEWANDAGYGYAGGC